MGKTSDDAHLLPLSIAMDMTNEKESVRLTIDDKTVTVPKGTTVHAAAAKLNIQVPIFCYHDRMPPFGACRICLVEVKGQNALKTSCTLNAEEGMVINTVSEKALRGRNEIMELLLINHPLDCPICDRGGECPLQEHTLHHGPGTSRFFEEKRHFKKPVDRGPVLMLDRERCIACARCTRFGEIIAGDNALEFIHRGYRTEVGTPDGGPAKSKFIGNTIMICPVGALTSRVYRFRARPWDNDEAESTCTLCPVGCSFVLDSRDGEIVRTRARENKDVNDIWLCDKGWFGYEFSSHPDRLRKPMIRRNGTLQEAEWDEALALAAEKIAQAKARKKIAGIGGNSLTVEENYLFQKLMREVAGVPHVDHRVGTPIFDLAEEVLPPGMQLTLGDVEGLDAAFLFGVDLTEQFPVMWLRLKQAINKGATVFFLGHFAPETAKFFRDIVVHAPGEELARLKERLPLAVDLAKQGKKVAFFIGTQYLHHQARRSIVSELLTFTEQHPEISLNVLEGNGNSLGARFAGMHPALLPGEHPAQEPGLDAVAVLQTAAREGWDVLYVAGADPANRLSSKLWNEARKKLSFLIVQDLFLTKTAQHANIVFPALSFLEKEGSFLNIESRVQNIHAGKNIPAELLGDGEIFQAIAQKLDAPLRVDDSFLQLLQTKRISRKRHRPQHTREAQENTHSLLPNQLFATFAPSLFDEGTRMRHNPHLFKCVHAPAVRIHPDEAEKLELSDGKTARFSSNGNIMEALVVRDRKVALKTAVFPLGFAGAASRELGANLRNGLIVEVLKT